MPSTGTLTAAAAIAGFAMSANTGFTQQEEGDEPAAAVAPECTDPSYVLDFTVQRLEGGEQDLNEYEGNVVLIVNTASKCGLTPQYAGLQSLYEKYKDDGLVILGFPANNFGNQEPGTNDQIADFCESNYSVTFPMFAKISVKGEDQHPLYRKLTSQPEPIGGDPEWNFTKFLVNRRGQVVQRFGPRTAPDDPELIAAVERLLADRPGSDGTTE